MTYINLGLPSGNLWCNCNYGTNIPTEAGKYFTFEEIEGLINNKEELIPTKDDFQELIDYCKWEWTDNGYKITGPNGNNIFLPAAGWSDETRFYSVNKGGHYWSSSSYNMEDAYRLIFYHNFRSVGLAYYYNRMNVRRIKKSNKMKEEVRIEVPEGYIIDKENSTFECIKFKKQYEVIITRHWSNYGTGVEIKTPDTEFILLDTYEVLANWRDAKKHCKTVHCHAELPSKEQCDVIYKYKEEINKYLENKIGGGCYWTSEEKGSSTSWGVNLNNGSSYTYNRYNVLRVRPIINM